MSQSLKLRVRGEGEIVGRRAPYGATAGGPGGFSVSQSWAPGAKPTGQKWPGWPSQWPASKWKASSWQNIVAKSQELGSKGHPWIWNFACSVSAVQDWTDCLNVNELGSRRSFKLKSWSYERGEGGLPRGSHLMWPPTCLHLNSATKQQNCTSWKSNSSKTPPFAKKKVKWKHLRLKSFVNCVYLF